MSEEKKLRIGNEIGDTIQLQFSSDESDRRYYVKLIGYMPEKSIILTIPMRDGKVMFIREGQMFNVRMLAGNTAQGFTSQALSVTSKPYPHMHLSYPTQLQSIQVRKAERVNCKLIVSVQNEEPSKGFREAKSASMSDISIAGSKMTSPEELGEVGDTITVNCRVMVAESEHYLRIAGIIRRSVKEQEGDLYEYGVEFVHLEQNEKLILHGFVYEQLIREK